LAGDSSRDGRRTIDEQPRGPGRRRPVTMRDIARETGLSQSTVSRVLNRRPTIIPIGEETRQRVLATAQTLGYRPNPLARGLRGSSTMLLGLIVREITDPFFAGAIETVTSAAARRGYNVVLGHAHARAEEAITLWGVLEARHCDAILLLGDMRDQPRLLHDLSGEHVPVVGLWHGAHTTELPCVAVDNHAGVRDVLDHLWGLGHRRIGFVGGRQLGDIKERGEAFVQYHEDAGQPLDADYLQLGLPDASGAIGALKRLLELPEPATAVVAATDVLAIGLLHAADLLGLRVPEQLSITGFDDIPMAMFTVPALTTMRMPVSEMVDQALRLALDDAGDSDQPVPVLKASLVVRSSTAPPGRE
jgi:DNA-binding LacI/PurR family transcriptional regulator